MNAPTRPEKHADIAAASKKTEALKENAASRVKQDDQVISPWQQIIEGTTVLACVDPGEGYFPAVVTSISRDGKTLSLRWAGAYSKLPIFKARRLAVGLICKLPKQGGE